MEYTLEEKYKLIKEELLKTKSNNPIEIIKGIMKKDYINMHGPEHHFLDGASLLTAYANLTKEIDLNKSLELLKERSVKMPGAMCGLWGVCGSVSSVGAALSIIHVTGPLSSDDYYKHHMEYTSRVLNKMSEIGGPRCCKRNAFIALKEVIVFMKEKYNVIFDESEIECDFSKYNKQCIGNKCFLK